MPNQRGKMAIRMATNLLAFAGEKKKFPDILKGDISACYHKTPQGMLFNSDCLDLLKKIKDKSINVVFADPPYNIKKAEWDKFGSKDDYLKWIDDWIKECSRILTDDGSAFIMGFTEILADVKSRITDNYFPNVRFLIWSYKNKPNLSKRDWVRSHESILHLRKGDDFYFDIDAIREPYNKHTNKFPEHAHGKTSQYGSGTKEDGTQMVWVPKEGAKPRDVIDIPAINNGMSESTDHPTQKPEALLRKLILGTSKKGDVVLDPFGGSGTTFVVCEQVERFWLGSEISPEYCKIIKTRLIKYFKDPKSLQYWLDLDLKRVKNRDKVRNGD